MSIEESWICFSDESYEDSVIAAKQIIINWSVQYYKPWYFPL